MARKSVEECAIVRSLKMDGAKLILRQSETDGAKEAIGALDVLGIVNSAAVC